MKITRDGSQLKINIDSGIGYYLTFTHNESCEANAEAWRVHLQKQIDSSEFRKETRLQELRFNVENLEATVRALRGHVTRLKNKVKP